MLKNCLFRPITMSLICVSTCWGATSWGEKDERDVLKAARTYHIMFSTPQSAQAVHRHLVGFKGAALLEQFKKTARAESRDSGSAKSGGDLGIVHEGEMVKSFETALFSLPPETLSSPIKSEFGWHLIYATDFTEKRIADVCSLSLDRAIKRATPEEKARLLVSKESVSTPNYAERISSLIGSGWGPPLKDGDGNLTFIRTERSNARPDQASAVIHTEYTHAVISASAQACRRSARAELLVDCAAKTATTTALYGFEGRGATGAKLMESHAKQSPVPFNQGLIGQIGKAACDAS